MALGHTTADGQAIDCGKWADIALNTDGTVTMWGGEGLHERLMPQDLKNVKAISAGQGIYLALKRDGTVVAWEGGAEWMNTDATTDIIGVAAGTGNAYVL